jgi:hypothetical protein
VFVVVAKPNYPNSKHQQYSGHRDALPNDTELQKGYNTLLELPNEKEKNFALYLHGFYIEFVTSNPQFHNLWKRVG